MYRCLLLLAAVFPAAAQPVLYACGNDSQTYVVGSKAPTSGLFHRDRAGGWTHYGYHHPLTFGFASDPSHPGALLLSAGNGLLRAVGAGLDWTQLTGSDVTELRDVDVDRSTGAVYFGYAAGIRVTRDGGKTWSELSGGLHRTFTESIRVDRKRSGVLLAGGEDGVFRSEDDGRSWRLAGASGVQILRIEQSPHDACFWLASTQGAGLFASHDCGVTFENLGFVGVGRNLYDVAFDPTTAGRIAVAGWGPGVVVSTDGGRSWKPRNEGLPGTEATAAVFDPATPGRLFVSIHDRAVYVSDDAGASWRKDGLEHTHVNRLRFVEVAR